MRGSYLTFGTSNKNSFSSTEVQGVIKISIRFGMEHNVEKR